mmetsp:Transcript_13211/g.55344  ORF Transcript_13211/g.55344 Transcript_13211/m.55344 type:complete len:370 (-) Transcript_13211:5346-6455(-)
MEDTAARTGGMKAPCVSLGTEPTTAPIAAHAAPSSTASDSDATLTSDDSMSPVTLRRSTFAEVFATWATRSQALARAAGAAPASSTHTNRLPTASSASCSSAICDITATAADHAASASSPPPSSAPPPPTLASSSGASIVELCARTASPATSAMASMAAHLPAVSAPSSPACRRSGRANSTTWAGRNSATARSPPSERSASALPLSAPPSMGSTVAATTFGPNIATSSLSASAAASRTATASSHRAACTAGSSLCRWSWSWSRDAACMTSASPKHTPCLVSSSSASSRPCCRMGRICARTLSPSFLTRSPNARPAMRLRSSESLARLAMSVRIISGRISLRVLGVLLTMVFHTCSDCWRTVMATSERAM